MDRGPSKNSPTENVFEEFDRFNLLRILIDNLPDQLYIKDTESRFVVNNIEHARDLGAASPKEIAGKTDFDFYPKELAEQYRADEREIIRSGQPMIGKEEPSVNEEGNRSWHSTTKVPLRNGSGKIVGLVGMTQDVTERKKTEEALRESEERFRSLTNAAFEGIAVNENGKILDANRAYADMFGYEVSELRGMPVLDLHPSEARDEVWRKISSGYSEPYETKGLKKDGATFDAEIRGRTVWYEDRFVRVTAIRDITERKRAQEELQKSHAILRTVTEGTTDAVYVKDRHSRYLMANSACARFLEKSIEEVIGKDDTELFSPTRDNKLSRPTKGLWPRERPRPLRRSGRWEG